MADKPVRVQLSRAKGWRMPANTVKVDRTTKWGNPFKVGEPYYNAETGETETCQTTERAVELFREKVDRDLNAPFAMHTEDSVLIVSGGYGDEHYHRPTIRKFLAGKNLACWCKLEAPCHADVLLELANPVEVIDR